MNRQSSSPRVSSRTPSTSPAATSPGATSPGATSPGATPPGPGAPETAQGQRRPRRGWRYLAGFLTIAVLLVVGARLTWSWLNPFAETTVDRSQPVLLQSIHNLSRFEAASGNFQVIVDLEKDAAFLPNAIKGSRTLFVGAGSVDAYVDFGSISSGALTVSSDGHSVTVRLPHAQLEKTNLDNKRSYVYAQERGILDRIQQSLSSSPQNQQELYVLAERKITEAAQSSDLRNRADQNTRAMMEGMLKSLGFKTVTIKYIGQP